MKVHIVIDWEGGGVIGAFENVVDARETKKTHQFPRFLSIESFETIKPTTEGRDLAALEECRRIVGSFPVSYNGNWYESIVDIEQDMELVHRIVHFGEIVPCSECGNHMVREGSPHDWNSDPDYRCHSCGALYNHNSVSETTLGKWELPF